MMYHQVELYLTTTKCYASAVRSLRINKRIHSGTRGGDKLQRTRGESRGSVATRTTLSDLFDFGFMT